MMDANYLLMWLGAFALTQAIEAPIYARFCVAGRWKAALLPSAVTHPLLWFALTPIWQQLRWPFAEMVGAYDPSAFDMPALYAMELAIAATEGWLLKRQGGHKPWLWALLGNGASFGVGELIYWLTGKN